MSSFTVIDFGEVKNHNFMTFELKKTMKCEKHNYHLVNLNKNNPTLHCSVCGDERQVKRNSI